MFRLSSQPNDAAAAIVPSADLAPENSAVLVARQMSAVREELEKEKGVISIIQLVDALIVEGHNVRASDIHIDPTEQTLRVRYRIDGVLQEAYQIQKGMASEIVTRLKILSGMRTDEHYAAQDGRFRAVVKCDGSDDVNVDVRVSVAPTYYGENAVLRLLSDKAEQFSLTLLGFSESNRERIERVLRKPYGMILATGPTGSGKTTTLYTMLKQLSTPDVSIVTIEDPIEYAISGIEQIQVNARTGLTFANGLRSILRQDPNIIMVGEIRDQETAQIAVNTALTGHLLLSTVHTTDSATTLPRLLDMGIEPYLIASTVNMAIGQRLVRKICEACREEYVPTAAERKSIKDHLAEAQMTKVKRFFRGKGCEACNGMGYRGRIGIHEVLLVEEPIRELILKKASSSDVKRLAVELGMTTMLEDGLLKAEAGETTIQEVLRVIHE